ncbi:cobalamin biosynthesis protein CbiG [Leucothrix sargassi]|nr:cobalamin biosynthesis protein CbiG [Leucothrix sargassi]
MIRIISLTEAGQRLGQTLSNLLPQSVHWHKPKPFKETVQNAFGQGDRLILICATGIAVRTLATVLTDKYHDPAVLVLDELGQFVIPLVSGHEGGANDWGSGVANLLEAQLVSTTAKPYLKPIYTIGMGCERGCPADHLQSLLEDCLTKAGLTLEQVSSINSIDIKADEVGLIALSEQLGKAYQTFDVQQLATVEDQLSTRSDYVFSVVGVYGVAESAAIFAAKTQTQEAAELILVKHKTAKATCAIARSYPSQTQ